ncbi:MAG TPA: efflux RND transporter periplasmic adaptor subunit [Polyangiaceae bacterium]|jgi:RND family efflux transporter MFP subunit|nr:efflux RND transporter periplasmic adaptor subunit [Polyangiaceae bacterium]
MTQPQTHDYELPTVNPRAKKILFSVAIAVLSLALVALLVAWLFGRHAEARDRSERENVEKLGPKLAVIRVESSLEDRELTLPGDVRGFEQITLYAKIAGYLRSIRVERGDHVESGQLLAQIESPENDADVISARSDAVIKHINAERARKLVTPGIISETDKENAENAEHMAQATLQRLNDVKSYETVRAPFKGVVTARYVDPGALMPAATGATSSAQPLVDLAETDKLRVFVYVGQDAAPFVRAGVQVRLWQDEIPEKQIQAEITRCADALDQRTRRMQCEVDLDNEKWAILPGTTLHVKLKIRVNRSPYVPNESLVIRDGKTLVAVVKNKRVHFNEVELGSTDGKFVRILRGLSPGDVIGVNTPVELDENDPVQPVDSKKTPSGADEKSAAKQPPADADREQSSKEKALGVERNQLDAGSEPGVPKPAASGK